ncbi:MAG: hypothetical protein HY275_00300 [Gemmatimonadetes bacterium]|nr:hypothetical protein [Gemmatimonadota bacterium]
MLGPARFTDPETGRDEALPERRALFIGLLGDAGAAGVPRDRIAALLWPGSTEGQASNATKQLIFKLRRQVGVRAIIEAGPVVRLSATYASLDLWDVLDGARRRDARAVLDAHGGRFLDGSEAWEPPDLELWLQTQRARALRLLHEATERLAATLAGAGDFAGAVRTWIELHERLPADRWVRQRLDLARSQLAPEGERFAGRTRGTPHLA